MRTFLRGHRLACLQVCIEYEVQFLFFTSDGCFFDIEDSLFSESTVNVMRRRVRYLTYEGKHTKWTTQKWMQHDLQPQNNKRIIPLK